MFRVAGGNPQIPSLMTALLVLKGPSCEVFLQYVQLFWLRKVVGRSAHDNHEKYCGWFWVHCSSKKFERMALETMDICLRMLKESSKSRFHSYSVRNSVLIISHIALRDCRVHNFSDNLSQNSCICITLYTVCHWCNNSMLQGPWRDTIWRGCIHH